MEEIKKVVRISPLHARLVRRRYQAALLARAHAKRARDEDPLPDLESAAQVLPGSPDALLDYAAAVRDPMDAAAMAKLALSMGGIGWPRKDEAAALAAKPGAPSVEAWFDLKGGKAREAKDWVACSWIESLRIETALRTVLDREDPALLRRVRERNRAISNALVRRYDARTGLGHTATAASDAYRAVAWDSGSAAAWYARSRCRLRIAEALKDVRKAAELSPKDPNIRQWLVEQLALSSLVQPTDEERRSMMAEAVATARSLPELDKSFEAKSRELVALCERRTDYLDRELVARIEKATGEIAKEPTLPRYLERAEYHILRGHSLEALPDLKAAEKLVPRADCDGLFYLWGLAAESRAAFLADPSARQKQLDTGIEAICSGIEANKLDTGSPKLRPLLEETLKRLHKKRGVLVRPPVLIVSAGKKLSKGDLQGAIADCRECLDLDPESGPAWGVVALAYWIAGEAEAAEEACETASAMGADGPEALDARAHVHAGRGKMEEAAGLAGDLLAKYPGYWRAAEVGKLTGK